MHKASIHKTAKKSISPASKVKKIVKKTIKKADLEKFSKAGKDRKLIAGSIGRQSLFSMLMEGKKEAKAELFASMLGAGLGGWRSDGRTALMLIFATDLNGEKELFPREELFKLLDGLRVLNIKAVVIDTEQPSDVNNLSELSAHQNGQIVWYNPKQDNSGRGREEKEIDRLLLAADMAVIFHEQMDLIKLLMNYGIVIVAEDKSPLLENYHPNEETGNSFLFKRKDLWSVFAAVVRALETHKFPYDWNHIIRQICR